MFHHVRDAIDVMHGCKNSGPKGGFFESEAATTLPRQSVFLLVCFEEHHCLRKAKSRPNDKKMVATSVGY